MENPLPFVLTICTDNNPSTYAIRRAKLDVMGHQWISALASYMYNFKRAYRPGKFNADADSLSRLNHEMYTSGDSIKVISQVGQLYAEAVIINDAVYQFMLPCNELKDHNSRC